MATVDIKGLERHNVSWAGDHWQSVDADTE